MRKQNRKALSILMIGVLLFLGISAELAHINCLIEIEPTQHLVTHRPGESFPIDGNLTTLCTACAFHSAQMATPQSGLSAIQFAPAGMMMACTASFDLQKVAPHFSLRAPPIPA